MDWNDLKRLCHHMLLTISQQNQRLALMKIIDFLQVQYDLQISPKKIALMANRNQLMISKKLEVNSLNVVMDGSSL